MTRLLLTTALLATFAAPALGHMAMTILKGTTPTNSRDYGSPGDNTGFPNQELCHGKQKGANQFTFTGNQKVQGRTTGGAGHNGGHCAWAISEDGKTWYKFNDQVDCTSQSRKGQPHDFVVPANAPLACKTGCVLGWFWTPQSSGGCEYYNNCWDITITDAQGGLKAKAPVIKTPKTTPQGTCFRVDGNTHLTAMYGALVTDATTALEPVTPTDGAGGKVTIAPPNSVGTKPEDKPGCLTYTVVQGDGLAKIAARFDIADYKTIYALNKDKMPDENTLNIGQVLLMPGDCDPAAGSSVTAGGPAAATAASVPLLAAVALVAVLVR